MAGGHAIAPKPGCPNQLDGLKRRARLDVEADPVALLDRADGALAVSPREGIEDRVTRAHRRDLRKQQSEPPDDQRERADRPQPKERDPSGALGRKRGRGSRRGKRPRHRLRGARGGPEDGPDDDGERPPRAGQDQCRRRASWRRRPAVTAPSAVAAAPIRSTVIRSRSTNSISPRLAARTCPELAQHRRERRGAVQHDVRGGGQLGRLIGGDPYAYGEPQLSRLAHRAQGAKRVEVGAIVTGEHGDLDRPALEEPPHRGPLVDPRRRPDLEHLSPPPWLEPRQLGTIRDTPRSRSAASGSAAPRQCRAWIGPLSSSRSPLASNSSSNWASTKSRVFRAPAAADRARLRGSPAATPRARGCRRT